MDGGGQARYEIITVIKQDTSGEGQTATGPGCVQGGRGGGRVRGDTLQITWHETLLLTQGKTQHASY